MKTRPLLTASRRLHAPVFLAIAAMAIAMLCGGPRVLAAKAPVAVIDLTKDTPPKTANSHNLGPTGALGWMQVEAGMTEKSRQYPRGRNAVAGFQQRRHEDLASWL